MTAPDHPLRQAKKSLHLRGHPNMDADKGVPFQCRLTGLARNAEFPAKLAHSLAFQKASHKTKTFFHHRTLSLHGIHTSRKGGKCYPCVRYKLSPISQVAHVFP